MKTLTKTALVLTTLLLGTWVSYSASEKKSQYMAVCTDGHGPLTAWLDSRDEANKVGKEHERATKGHRWDIKERDKATDEKKKPERQAQTEVTLECLKYFATGKDKEVGIRNNCNECKTAVVIFRYTNGKSEIKRFDVPAFSEIKVDITGANETELIGEEPCKKKK